MTEPHATVSAVLSRKAAARKRSKRRLSSTQSMSSSARTPRPRLKLSGSLRAAADMDIVRGTGRGHPWTNLLVNHKEQKKIYIYIYTYTYI